MYVGVRSQTRPHHNRDGAGWLGADILGVCRRLHRELSRAESHGASTVESGHATVERICGGEPVWLHCARITASAVGVDCRRPHRPLIEQKTVGCGGSHTKPPKGSTKVLKELASNPRRHTFPPYAAQPASYRSGTAEASLRSKALKIHPGLYAKSCNNSVTKPRYPIALSMALVQLFSVNVPFSVR